MSPFDALTLKDVIDRIPDRDADWLKSNLAFYTGDHWQDGDGWAGPRLDSGHKLYLQTLAEIQRGFVSKNAVKEVVSRHVAGVIGREPAWFVTVRRSLAEGETPIPAEQQLIAEAESLLVSWWDSQQGVISTGAELVGVHKTIQSVVAALLLSRRGALRLFVPPGELDESGRVPQSPLAESVRRIYIHQPEATQSAVVIDRRRMARLGIYLYQENDEERAELTYLDGKNTIVRIVRAGDDADFGQPVQPIVGNAALNLGRRLTMYELRRPILITNQVRQLQKALNLALTMMQRNVVQAGFLERTFFNTQLPGREVPDPDRPGQTKFIPEAFNVGPGVTNFLSGVSYEDSEGNTQVATPSVVYRDPVNVDTFQATQIAAYRNILEEVQQLHALIAGDSTPSGESRRQAMNDFEQSLLLTKSEVNAALRWLLETVLAMAAVFSGQPGRYAALRINAEARLQLGPISADDQKIAGDLVDRKLLSRETAMTRIGVEDTDAEKNRITQETEQDKQSLATSLLNAQSQLAGGAQSNGLENPSIAAPTAAPTGP